MAPELLEQRSIIAIVHQHRNILVVLGGGADHRRAADIDVLDAGGKIAAAGNGFFEGIKVYDHNIDGEDFVRPHGFDMLGIAAPCQKSAVHRRMQRLDAAVHHFRKAGELAHIEHFQSGLAEDLARAAGRNQLNAEPGECMREIHDAGFVRNRNQRARGAAQIVAHRAPICVAFA